MKAKLTTWILVAAAAGLVAGYLAHGWARDATQAATIAGYFSILSDIFLRLIKMVIAPLVFATVTAVATTPGIMNEWFSTYLPMRVVPDRSKLIAAISEP